MTRPTGRRTRAGASARTRSLEVLRCDVSDVAADAAAVDALARLALTLRRQGCRLELHGVSAELQALVAFMGLAEVLLS